jgi:hypothetical protein
MSIEIFIGLFLIAVTSGFLCCLLILLQSGIKEQMPAQGNTNLKQFYLEEDNGDVVARWWPPETGMCEEGRGATVLEAIGSLCLYSQTVRQAKPSDLVNTRFSVGAPSCPRR